ncbi:MAG TPA: N-acetylmuramoyl-L-alanine amidase [Spirochaetota bacterium]|nr:N-acetylmuramoyl-L-alanine amidase [Spirochaetota bacterium]HPR36331.1 N-acetylmuramoyl-L-alanine amidase [Spirochaetota bacterium]
MLKHIQFTAQTGKKFNLAVVLILLLSLTGAAAERSIQVEKINGLPYVSLNRLITTFGIESSFDPVFQKGRLYYKTHYLVYKTGYASIIIDNRLINESYPVIRMNGGIYIPKGTALLIAGTFFSNSIITEKNGKIVISEAPAPEIKEKIINLKEKKGKIGFIIIDPGHGGKDPGAIGKGGLKEKTINLQVARKVESKLKKNLAGLKIKLTRKNDRFIELAERAEIANRELRKDVNGLFVSIHVNASISSRISGFETYFLSQNPTNEEARKTATLENNVIVLENDGKGKHKYNDLEYMEALMLTTQIQKESSILADTIQKNLDKKITEFKSRGVHKADFYVLRGALMPAVLIEIGFITHKKEAEQLKKNAYQEKIAEGISNGILKFIDEYNKMIE